MLHSAALFLLASALTVEEDPPQPSEPLSSLGAEAPKHSFVQESAWQEVSAEGVAPGKLLGPGRVPDSLVKRQAWQYTGAERDVYTAFLSKWALERSQYRNLYGFVQSALGNLMDAAKQQRAVDFLLAIGRKMNEDEEAGYWTWRAVQKQAESMRIPYVEDDVLEHVIMIAREFKYRHKVEGGGEDRGSMSARVKRTGKAVVHRLRTGEDLEGTWPITPPTDDRLLQPELPPEGLPIYRRPQWTPRAPEPRVPEPEPPALSRPGGMR